MKTLNSELYTNPESVRTMAFAALTGYVASGESEEHRKSLQEYNNPNAFRCKAIRVAPHTLIAYARKDKTICIPPARFPSYVSGDRACLPTFSLENVNQPNECLVVKREFGYWDDQDVFHPEVEIINKLPTAKVYLNQVNKDGSIEEVHAPMSRCLFSYKAINVDAPRNYCIQTVEYLPGAYVGDKGDYSINISNGNSLMSYRFNLEKVYAVLKALQYIPDPDILVDTVFCRDLNINHCCGDHFIFSDVELTSPILNHYHRTYLLNNPHRCKSINAVLGFLAIFLDVNSDEFKLVTKTLATKNAKRDKNIVSLINNTAQALTRFDKSVIEVLKAYGTCLINQVY